MFRPILKKMRPVVVLMLLPLPPRLMRYLIAALTFRMRPVALLLPLPPLGHLELTFAFAVSDPFRRLGTQFRAALVPKALRWDERVHDLRRYSRVLFPADPPPRQREVLHLPLPIRRRRASVVVLVEDPLGRPAVRDGNARPQSLAREGAGGDAQRGREELRPGRLGAKHSDDPLGQERFLARRMMVLFRLGRMPNALLIAAVNVMNMS
mmetsp:Transcript_47792/g.101563  ORF Transcript_47792/g.101563 Transcript_47792/m.101563 type:complete len:209 (+) Transcript_47792:889-1515(+)